MKALIVSADHFEDSELLFPLDRLQEEGLQVDIASIARGKINGKHGYEVQVAEDFERADVVCEQLGEPEQHQWLPAGLASVGPP